MLLQYTIGDLLLRQHAVDIIICITPLWLEILYQLVMTPIIMHIIHAFSIPYNS